MEEQEFLTEILEKTMLISEKRKFYNGSVTEKNLENLKKWKNQKNLVDEKVLKLILEKEEMSEDEFAYSITPIHVPEKYDKPEWLQVLDDIMQGFEKEKLKSLEMVDISVVIFPFMAYVGDKLNEFDWGQSGIGLSEDAFKDILQSYMVQTIHFFEKCIVIELENYHASFSKAKVIGDDEIPSNETREVAKPVVTETETQNTENNSTQPVSNSSNSTAAPAAEQKAPKAAPIPKAQEKASSHIPMAVPDSLR